LPARLWLRSALVSGISDAHFENRLWSIKIAVQSGVALWSIAVWIVVQFSKQRQAGPTPPLQRTL
jgi:hypothetical protein